MFASSFGPMTKTARETGEEGIARKLYLSLNATDEKVSRFLNDFSMWVIYGNRLEFSLNFLLVGMAGNCSFNNNWHFVLCPLVQTGKW